MLYALWPLNTAFVAAVVAIVVALVVRAPRDSWLRSGPIASFVWRVGLSLPWVTNDISIRVAILAAWTSFFGLLLISQLQRCFLRELLRDKSFLYSARSPTLWTKVWFILVKALTRGSPMLYSFQSSLPRMPVPPLQDTVNKYLERVKLLQSDEDYARTAERAALFLATDGPTLQRYLYIKSWFTPNYVTDWYVYASEHQ